MQANQTIRQRRAIRAFSANDPRVERATYHRDPQWFEGPEYNPERAVGWALRLAVIALVMLALGERYGVDLIAGVL